MESHPLLPGNLICHGICIYFNFSFRYNSSEFKNLTVQKFRDGEFQVLVATRVGEEGLDISEVNQVIFYDNIPSSIRFIQRRGRTGRKDSGKLTVLIAKDTIDERYYWIGKRKMSAAKGMGEKMTRTLQQNNIEKKGLDAFV